MMRSDSRHTPFWFTRGVLSGMDVARRAGLAVRTFTGGLLNTTLAVQRAGAGLLLCGTAHAHEGHGLPGVSHWHSTDALGFVVAGGVAVGLAIWMKGRK